MDPPGQLGQPPGPGYGHHACNGQADGADGKPGKGQPDQRLPGLIMVWVKLFQGP